MISLIRASDLELWLALDPICDLLAKDYFLKSEWEPLVNRFREKFVAWHDGPIKFPNFHLLCCHFVEQCEFLGPPWASSTQNDERLHTVVKTILKEKTNGLDISLDTLMKVRLRVFERFQIPVSFFFPLTF